MVDHWQAIILVDLMMGEALTLPAGDFFELIDRKKKTSPNSTLVFCLENAWNK